MFEQDQHIFTILFEAISEGVIVIDKKQMIIATNTSVKKMFGYKKKELTNQSLTILIPPKYHSNHKDYVLTFLKNGTSQKMGQERNIYGVKKNKKEFPIEISLNPFTINGNTYIMAIIIDITTRKKNELEIATLNAQLEKRIKERTAELNHTIEQLKELNFNFQAEIKKRVQAENKIKTALQKEKELNDLKTKFLSMVAHEFKTPLSGILTSTILLEKYTLSQQQDKREKHLKTITSKVHYLNSILNDFLSIERLESNKVNYKFSTFNLSKVINEVVYNANMLLKSGQKIHIPQNIDEYTLYQDEKILELMLSNLIHNAIKYSSENTHIKLKVKLNGKQIIFEIIDQGFGIPKNNQKYIFNRYFRAENVLNTQGTGIGLNIVKSHLENLGGSIHFTSKENVGSTFTINLPIRKEL